MISLVALLTLIAAPAVAVTVTLGTSSYIRATAYDGSTFANPFNDALTLPDSGTVFADGGASSATTGFILSNTGFALTFSHARNGATNAVSESLGALYFSVDSEVNCVLEGFYSASDETGRRTTMDVQLHDETEGWVDMLFRNLQQSEATANESFTLGQQEGDTQNTLVGSFDGALTGTLFPDRIYRFYFRTNIWTGVGGDTSAASANGELSLTFVPVPEPTTAFLVAVGLAGIAAARRRRSQH